MRLSDAMRVTTHSLTTPEVVSTPDSSISMDEKPNAPSAINRFQAGFERGLGSGGQLVGEMTMYLGDYIRNEAEHPRLGIKSPFADTAKTIGDRIVQAGRMMYERNKVALEKQYPQQDLGAGKKDFAGDFGQGAASLAASIGMGLVTGPESVGAAFGVAQKARTFREARMMGKSFSEADRISNLLGFAEGGLEYVGLDHFIKASGGVIKEAAKRYVIEATQEFSQSLSEGVIRTASGMQPYNGYDSAVNILTDAVYSGAIGGVLGAAASIPMTAYNRLSVETTLRNAGIDKATAESKADLIMQNAMDDVVSEVENMIPGESGQAEIFIPTGSQAQDATQRIFNRFQSIEDTVARAKALGADIKPGEDAGMSADRYLSISNQVESVLRDGTYRINQEGNVEITGEGLKPILDDFSKVLPGSDKDLNQYLIARRTIEDLQRPKGQGSTENIATDKQVMESKVALAMLKSKHGGLGEFENTAQRIYEFQKRVLENLVDSGMLSQEKFLNILDKNQNYIPFDRIMPDEQQSGVTPVAKKPFSGVRNPVKKIKGSDLAIHDPIESIIKNTYKIMDAASRNRVFREIYTLKDIPELGLNAKRPDFRAIEVSQEESGGDALTIFRPSSFAPKGNIVEGFIDGKRKYLEVSENLKSAMIGLNEKSSGLFVKLLSQPASWLRVGATITPEFILRNPIRDQWTALLQTHVGFRPFLDSGGAVADILGKSDVYKEWIRSGGSYAGFVELTQPALAQKVAELRGNPSMLKNLNILHTMQEISQVMEQATRLGVYKAAIRKGMTAVEAARQSRESTLNFARRGTDTKDINATIAFFNAGLQSINKSYLVVKDDPAGFTMKAIATITIPSLLLYIQNRNEDDYQEIPRWQRDLFWMFKVGENWYRIPKPFLYGQVFGSLPERFMEYLDSQDKSAFTNLGESLYNALSPVAGDPISGLMPTAVRPLIENMTNWSFFRERNIVPESKKKLVPSEQYGKYDTETSKLFGAILNVSPSKIENLVSGWLGGSGRYALQAGDKFMEFKRQFEGNDPKINPPTELADIPLVKGFAARSPKGYQSESVQKFYNAMEKISELSNTYKKFVKANDSVKAASIKERNPEISLTKKAKDVAKKISDLSDKIDEVNSNAGFDNESKREMIKAYQEKMTILAKDFNEQLKQFKQ